MEWQCDHVVLFNGEIEAYNKWGPEGFDYQKAIDSKIVIEELPFWNIHTLLDWKRIKNRPKDVQHIKMIESYLQNDKPNILPIT